VAGVLIAVASLAALLAVYRILAGPSDSDRVIALDVLFAAAVTLAIAAAIATGRTAFLDVAVGLALVGFVGTLAWARLIEERSGSGEEDVR
jgi:multicomponent Na+:H+ antiporter subunit F